VWPWLHEAAVRARLAAKSSQLCPLFEKAEDRELIARASSRLKNQAPKYITSKTKS
jgi:hypothetical protein